MLNILSLIQVKAFARIDGALLALLWTASFLLMIYLPQSMLGSLLIVATPFFVLWRLIKFRTNALDGVISFRRAFAYGCFTFFYASMLFAVVQFLYFQFLDSGKFVQMLLDTLKIIGPIYKQNGIDTADAYATLGILSGMSPIEKAFTFMMQNIFIGSFVSLFAALIGARRARH